MEDTLRDYHQSHCQCEDERESVQDARQVGRQHARHLVKRKIGAGREKSLLALFFSSKAELVSATSSLSVLTPNKTYLAHTKQNKFRTYKLHRTSIKCSTQLAF